jgi:hypothetical protein
MYENTHTNTPTYNPKQILAYMCVCTYACFHDHHHVTQAQLGALLHTPTHEHVHIHMRSTQVYVWSAFEYTHIGMHTRATQVYVWSAFEYTHIGMHTRATQVYVWSAFEYTHIGMHTRATQVYVGCAIARKHCGTGVLHCMPYGTDNSVHTLTLHACQLFAKDSLKYCDCMTLLQGFENICLLATTKEQHKCITDRQTRMPHRQTDTHA